MFTVNVALATASGAAGTLGSNWTSVGVQLRRFTQASIQIVYTGSSLVGTFKLQYSDDDPNAPGNPQPGPTGVSNWTDVAGSSSASSAAGGSVMWDLFTAAHWVRVVWTASSGSGAITSARLNAKGAQ